MEERVMLVQRFRRGEEDDSDQAYAILTPAERLGMMWQLALDAWAFAGYDQLEPGLSRHPVVLQRRAR